MLNSALQVTLWLLWVLCVAAALQFPSQWSHDARRQLVSTLKRYAFGAALPETGFKTLSLIF